MYKAMIYKMIETAIADTLEDAGFWVTLITEVACKEVDGDIDFDYEARVYDRIEDDRVIIHGVGYVNELGAHAVSGAWSVITERW